MDKPNEISRKVITEQGYRTEVTLPEMIKGVTATLIVHNQAEYPNNKVPVVTTVWVAIEVEEPHRTQ